MDPHFRLSLEPVPERLTNLGAWIREHSDESDVFFAGADVAQWIPALTGRRIVRTGLPWLDTDAYRLERRLLFPGNEEEGRAALRQLGADYVVFDLSLQSEHHLAADGLELPSLDLVFESDYLKVYRSKLEQRLSPGR